MANEELREQNIRNVLREALNCFIEFGIDQTKVSTIAQRAGVNQRSIYRYFYTKEHLVVKVAVTFWDEIFQSLHEMYRSREYQEKTGMEQVRLILEFHAKTFNEKYISNIWLQELNIYILKTDIASEHNRQFIEEFQYLRTPLKKALEKGVADRTIRSDYPAEYLNTMITGTFEGMLQKLAVQRKCYNIELDDTLKIEFKIYIDMLLTYLPNPIA